jgi:hypothetical protein
MMAELSRKALDEAYIPQARTTTAILKTKVMASMY